MPDDLVEKAAQRGVIVGFSIQIANCSEEIVLTKTAAKFPDHPDSDARRARRNYELETRRHDSRAERKSPCFPEIR